MNGQLWRRLLRKFKAIAILLVDLNVNSMDKTDSQYHHLWSFCLSHQLNELVQKPTRITGDSAKCLDLMLSNMSNLQTPTVTHTDYTDHSLVSSTIQFVRKEMPTTDSVIRTRRRWKTDNSQLNIFIDPIVSARKKGGEER